MGDAKHTPAFRQHITKSRAGHYAVSIRDSVGQLVTIVDKLPTLEQARAVGRAAIAKATGSASHD